MNSNEMEALVWQQLFAQTEKFIPVITKYSVCIYAWQSVNSALVPAGTGVLLQVAGKHFLMSAAHVMDYTFYHGIQFYAAGSVEAEKPVALAFERRRCSARPIGLSDKDPDLRDLD